MLGLPPAVLRASLRPLAARWLAPPGIDWATSRTRFEQSLLVPRPPRGTSITTGAWGGVSGLELVPPGADRDRVLIYLHGGGYCIGSPKAYRAMASRIGRAAGARVVLPDYGMADERPHPAAVEDALAVYRAVLDEGVPPERIAVAGDSAGGGLALALCFAARAAGLPMPAALGLICPWADLRPQTQQARPVAPDEPLLTHDLMDRFTASYLAGADPDDPLISPITGDFAGLPALVLQWAEDDLLAPDGRAVGERAHAAGVPIEERSFAGLWHDFHLVSPLLAGPGRDALPEMGRGLRRHLS